MQWNCGATLNSVSCCFCEWKAELAEWSSLCALESLGRSGALLPSPPWMSRGPRTDSRLPAATSSTGWRSRRQPRPRCRASSLSRRPRLRCPRWARTRPEPPPRPGAVGMSSSSRAPRPSHRCPKRRAPPRTAVRTHPPGSEACRCGSSWARRRRRPGDGRRSTRWSARCTRWSRGLVAADPARSRCPNRRRAGPGASPAASLRWFCRSRASSPRRWGLSSRCRQTCPSLCIRHDLMKAGEVGECSLKV